jgi:predicted transcriptional regulator
VKHFARMTTISLKLPDDIAARLKLEARARKSTPAKLAREVLEKSLPETEPPSDKSV